MTANRSLDEFATAPSESAEADPDAAASASGADRAGPESATAESGTPVDGDAGGSAEGGSGAPVASTYAWSPGGAPCADCGQPAEERWRDGDGLVCADCKAW